LQNGSEVKKESGDKAPSPFEASNAHAQKDNDGQNGQSGGQNGMDDDKCFK